MRGLPQLAAGGRSRGFTLLELIVSFTILALLAAVMYGALRMATESYARSQDRIEKKARERVLKDFVARQVGSLFPLRPRAAYLEEQSQEFDPNTSGVVPFQETPLFHGTRRTVTFVTVAPLMIARNPGLTVVTYGRAEDEYGNEYLGAMETRFMGVESFDMMANLPRGKPLPIAEGISDVTFSYYGYDPTSDTYDWFDEWYGDEVGAVPSALRIEFDEQEIIVPINATDTSAGNLGRRNIQRLLSSSGRGQ